VANQKPDVEKVRELRLARGWSQEQLAKVAGLSPRTIQRLEAGEGAAPRFRRRSYCINLLWSSVRLGSFAMAATPSPSCSSSWCAAPNSRRTRCAIGDSNASGIARGSTVGVAGLGTASTRARLKGLGADDRVLATLMGHRDVRSVEKYAKLTPQTVAKIISRLESEKKGS